MNMKTLMKKGWLIGLLGWCLAVGAVRAEENRPDRYIEVTGTAQQEVEPDKIHFLIGLEEYWVEESDTAASFEQYRTKVPLQVLEKKLRSVLRRAGVQDRQIQVCDAGNYYRHRGKEMLLGKQFDVTLTDFGQIDRILYALDSRGVNQIRVGELKNRNLPEYRLQVKVMALEAARKKAARLLESQKKKLGDVVSIVELPDEGESGYWRAFPAAANVYAGSPAGGESELRKIRLRYSVRVRYEIE